MPIQSVGFPPQPFIQPLENRRLLSVTPVGPEVTVPMPTPMTRFDMGVAGDGSFIVVGDPIEQPGSPDLVAVRYDASGQQIGQPLTLDDRGFNVSASMNADGDAVVAYQKGTNGVYIVRVSKDGAASAPQRVGTAPVGQSVWETSVSMDDAGGFFVTWLQREPDFSPLTIEVRAFDAAGQPRGPQFSAASGDSTIVKDHIDIAALPDGSGAVLVYSSGHDNGSSLTFQRLSAQGIVGSGSVGGTDPLLGKGDVAVRADGSFVVGYARFGGANGIGGVPQFVNRFVDRFDATGTFVGGVLVGASVPTTPNDGLADEVMVDALPDGGFVVGFARDQDGTVTTYAEHFTSAGLSTNGAVVVDAGGARAPVIGAGGADVAVLAYLQPNLGLGDVHVRRLEIGDFAELRGTELFVNGTDSKDHIIVERVGTNLFVNVNGFVERFNASAVRFLSISALGGEDDVINATDLPATLSGGDDADTLWGGTGADRLRGFGGDDVLRGGDGDDALLGDSGDDTLHGGDGIDTLTGGEGDDSLVLGEVSDEVVRGLSFANGVLTFTGTDADDSVTVTRVGPDLIVSARGAAESFPLDGISRIEMFGRGGRDILRLGGDFRIPALLDGGTGSDILDGGDGSDTLLGGDGHEDLNGGRGEDRLEGGADDDTMYGEIASDTLLGGDGNDTMFGGSEDNWLDGGAGRDSIVGGDGVDGVNTLDYSSRTNPIRIVPDPSELNPATGGEAGEDDQIRGVQRVLGGAGDDFIAIGQTILAGGGDDTLVGSDADDQLFGQGGNDQLLGGGGDDYLEGGAGHDELYGQGGNDALFGLTGNDRLFSDDGAADTVRGGPGDDGAEADDEDDVLAVETVA